LSRHVIVTGAAGFVGSHLVDALLAAGHTVTGIDNLARGCRENLSAALEHRCFRLIESDLAADSTSRRAFDTAAERGKVAQVWHMAANSDIAAGVADPDVDLRDTFLTTYYTLASMRRLPIPEIAFASTSAVYGAREDSLGEDSGPLLPVSNYGAMKLASEGAISAAVESFLDRAFIFRFPNVLGPRATHGIIFDLLGKLRRCSAELEVLGDGNQQKPYMHVSDLIEALQLIAERARERINCFNIAPEDEGVTVRWIAETVVRVAAPGTPIRYTGGTRGWVGDVPRFNYCIAKLSALGWRPRLLSRAAVERAVNEVHAEMTACSS